MIDFETEADFLVIAEELKNDRRMILFQKSKYFNFQLIDDILRKQ
jgi:hypothetical protein